MLRFAICGTSRISGPRTLGPLRQSQFFDQYPVIDSIRPAAVMLFETTSIGSPGPRVGRPTVDLSGMAAGSPLNPASALTLLALAMVSLERWGLPVRGSLSPVAPKKNRGRRCCMVPLVRLGVPVVRVMDVPEPDATVSACQEPSSSW